MCAYPSSRRGARHLKTRAHGRRSGGHGMARIAEERIKTRQRVRASRAKGQPIRVRSFGAVRRTANARYQTLVAARRKEPTHTGSCDHRRARIDQDRIMAGQRERTRRPKGSSGRRLGSDHLVSEGARPGARASARAAGVRLAGRPTTAFSDIPRRKRPPTTAASDARHGHHHAICGVTILSLWSACGLPLHWHMCVISYIVYGYYIPEKYPAQKP